MSKLAPKKPTWDLKRDVQKKLDKLERRTQRAIAELVAERLRQQNEGSLDVAVSAGAAAGAVGAEEANATDED